MEDNNITTYNELFMYYVARESTLLQENRTAVYWINPATNFLQFKSSDILQYWGDSTDVAQTVQEYSKNKFILSNYDYAYLDCGMGNYFGANSWCDPYKTWLQIYNFEPTKLIPQENLNQILGLETCQWGELFNVDSLEKTFPRASALAERAWSPLDNIYDGELTVVKRLNQFIANLQNRGIQSGPITSEFCVLNPTFCFKN